MSVLEPKICPFCDFGSGQRGMSHCRHCDGTGSVFYVGAEIFPNTVEGYSAATNAIHPRLRRNRTP